MMFDAMCRAAEVARDERFASRLRMSSLLLMPFTGPLWASAEERSRLEDSELRDFRLLWPFTVVEWGDVAVLLSRMGRTGGPALKVTMTDNLPHGAVGYADTGGDGSIDATVRVGTDAVGLLPGDTLFVAVTGSSGGRRFTATADVIFYERASPRHRPRICVPLKGDGGLQFNVFEDDRVSVKRIDLTRCPVDLFHTLLTDVQNKVLAASTLLSRAAAPSHWVVKQQTEFTSDPLTSPKIPRSHQRPRWLVITDKERVRYFRNDAPAKSADGKEVTPHPRRAHYRHIGENEDGSKKYTWVRACWVGSTEAEIRGARYKVELDL